MRSTVDPKSPCAPQLHQREAGGRRRPHGEADMKNGHVPALIECCFTLMQKRKAGHSPKGSSGRHTVPPAWTIALVLAALAHMLGLHRHATAPRPTSPCSYPPQLIGRLLKLDRLALAQLRGHAAIARQPARPAAADSAVQKSVKAHDSNRDGGQPKAGAWVVWPTTSTPQPCSTHSHPLPPTQTPTTTHHPLTCTPPPAAGPPPFQS
jgi:hypothetical protein